MITAGSSCNIFYELESLGVDNDMTYQAQTHFLDAGISSAMATHKGGFHFE